jgi:catechol 2,3-dioxygenase-like lactoylglutathione lyase family enzyme
MRTRALIPAAIFAGAIAGLSQVPATAQTALPPPHFHHLHLNATNPDAAIDFYTRQFVNTSGTTWNGFPALKAPTNVMIMFTKVNTPPRSDPQETAVWHFGWQVIDVRKKLEFYEGHSEVRVSPMYKDDDSVIFVNSDTVGGTRAEIAAARAKGTKPPGGRGVMYIAGPDNALIENVGNNPVTVERFNHVHMYQEDPYCAQIWYQKHLNASIAPALVQNPQRTEANCKVERGEKSFPALVKGGMYRAPNSGVLFDDVAINWPVTQLDKPLASTNGHLVDHIALSVPDLDAWAAKLRGEGVKFLKQPHRLGDTRALMVEGPSREQIEILEVK